MVDLIDSGFDDFMRPEGLCRDPDRPQVVHDTVEGVDLYHDFDPCESIGDQYNVVAEKYLRRIRRLQAVNEPVLFVRYIDSEPGRELGEFEFLDQNMDRVLEVLRRSHAKNDLLLIGNSGLPATCGGLTVYTAPPDDGDLVAREFLRKNSELSWKLMTLRYPPLRRVRNLLVFWNGRLARRIITRQRRQRLRRALEAHLVRRSARDSRYHAAGTGRRN